MESAISKNWWLVLLKGVILILLAFLVFGNPMGTLLGLSLFLGIGILIAGIIIVIIALAAKNEMENWGWKLAEGILDIIFGFMLIANPEITSVVIPFIIGFWAVFYGILITIGAFSLEKTDWKLLILGVLTILLGNVIMFNPIFMGITLSIWIGITLLVAGIYNVVYSFDIKKIEKVAEEIV